MDSELYLISFIEHYLIGHQVMNFPRSINLQNED